jgi:hypothetical protein
MPENNEQKNLLEFLIKPYKLIVVDVILYSTGQSSSQ